MQFGPRPFVRCHMFFVIAFCSNILAANATGCIQTEHPISLPGHPLIFYQFLCKPTVYHRVPILPDLDITVDFTALNEIIALTWPTFAQISIPISIGLTNSHGTTSIEDIFGRSPPVSLIHGMNIVAPYKLRARQVFTNRAIAALGVFQVRRLCLILLYSAVCSTLYTPIENTNILRAGDPGFLSRSNCDKQSSRAEYCYSTPLLCT